jgi:ubiquinone/menaquinone biosynthesis C-methylase UbiE
METYWSRFVEDYDNRRKYVGGIELDALTKRRFEEQQELGEILEFGCGTGDFTRCVVAQSKSVLATDYSSQMVSAMERIFAGESKVTVQQANCHATNLPDISFDTVMMCNLIHIIPEPQKAIAEAHRLLRPGGTLLLSCFTVENTAVWHKLALLYRYLRTFGGFPKERTAFAVATLSEVVRSAGFEIEEATILGKTTKAIFLKAIKIQEGSQ